MTNALPNEIELLGQLIQGDPVAFRQIYDHYQERIFIYAYRYTKSKIGAAEIVQEVFIKLWKKRSQVDANNNFEAYIKTITRNHILNILKKTARDKLLQQELYKRMQTIASLPIDCLLEKELSGVHQKAVSLLSPQQKIIYTLSKEQDLTYVQIAKKLSLSKHTVKNHITEALKSIRRHVSNNTDIAYLLITTLLFKK